MWQGKALALAQQRQLRPALPTFVVPFGRVIFWGVFCASEIKRLWGGKSNGFKWYRVAGIRCGTIRPLSEWPPDRAGQPAGRILDLEVDVAAGAFCAAWCGGPADPQAPNRLGFRPAPCHHRGPQWWSHRWGHAHRAVRGGRCKPATRRAAVLTAAEAGLAAAFPGIRTTRRQSGAGPDLANGGGLRCSQGYGTTDNTCA